MASIQDFLAASAVASGEGSQADTGQALNALDAFLANFGKKDQRAALIAADGALRDLQLSSGIAADLQAVLDARIAALHPRLVVDNL